MALSESAPVSISGRESSARSRRRHRFKIYGVLVDIDDHQRSSLAAIADEMRTVTELTIHAVKGLFANL